MSTLRASETAKQRVVLSASVRVSMRLIIEKLLIIN